MFEIWKQFNQIWLYLSWDSGSSLRSPAQVFFFMSLERVATAEVFFLSFTNKEQLPRTGLKRPFFTWMVSAGFVFFLIVANQKLVGMRVLMKY